jgi:predicted HAD superfamily Cof-like phosphohydrolase
MIKEIHEFNTKLLDVKTGSICFPSQQEQQWLVGALREEIDEFLDAKRAQSIIGCVDSLLDLAYFAIGGCVRFGLNPEQIEDCFQAIHAANMAKRKGVKESRPQDGTVSDAVKPEGWIAPEVAMQKILYEDF